MLPVAESVPAHQAPQTVGHVKGCVQRSLRQQHDELFASVTATDIVAALVAPDEQTQVLQNRVAPLVTVGIVDALEVIDVYHDQAQGPLVTPPAPPFHADAVEELAPVVEPGERVGRRLDAQRVVEAGEGRVFPLARPQRRVQGIVEQLSALLADPRVTDIGPRLRALAVERNDWGRSGPENPDTLREVQRERRR